jgi:hypothetical protein
MQNVERFRAHLNNETNPERRILLQRLLVEEEDKVGATFELLEGVQRAIADCKRQIAELRLLLETIQTDGHGAIVTKVQLETLTDSQRLHEAYCRKLQSKLYDDGI